MVHARTTAARLVPAAALALAGAVLSGCLGAASGAAGSLMDKMLEPGPTRLAADVVADDNLNPDYGGRPSPLVVRLYELKNTVAFENADFFALYEGDVGALEADLINREEFQIKPGEQKEIERKLDPETAYLGVLAAYRDIDNAVWRKTLPMEAHSWNEVKITFKASEIVAKVDD
jgi:type VI secretion system protein VasD